MPSITRLNPNEYQEWDKFVTGNNPRNLFALSGWIIAAARFNGASPVIVCARDQGDIMAGISGVINIRHGLKILEPPAFTPYNGFLFLNDENKTDVNLAANELLDYVRNLCDRLVISHYPRAAAVNLFGYAGQNELIRKTLIIKLSDREKLYQGFTHAVRKQIKKAERSGIEVTEYFDAELMFKLQMAILKRAGVPLRIDKNGFCESLEDLRNHGWIKMFSAMKGNIHCGAWVLTLYGDTCHSLLTGILPEYYQEGTGAKLTADTLTKLSEEGLKFLDFGGINIPGIRRFKESFGGEEEEYTVQDFAFNFKTMAYRFMQKYKRGRN